MSDIRGFFGKAKAPIAPTQAAPAPKSSRKLVVEDDDDEDSNENGDPTTNGKAAVGDALPTAGPKSPLPSKAASSEVESKPADASASSSSSGESGASNDSIPSVLSDIVTWKAGESVPYLALVNIFERVTAVSGRLEKESLFCKLFRAVILTTPKDLVDVVYLVSNTVAPAYEGLELGIGDSLLVKAVCESTGRNKAAVEEDYAREGDLGTVAFNSRNNQKTLSFASKPTPLLASHVLKQFRQICATKGDKAQQKKVEIIKALMVKGQGAEVKYIVRALQGNLRTGSAKQTVLVSLAQAFVYSPTAVVQQLVLSDNGKEKLPGYIDIEDEDPAEEDGDDDVEEHAASGSKGKATSLSSKTKAATDAAAAASAEAPASKETDVEASDAMQTETEGPPAEKLEILFEKIREIEPTEARKLRKALAGKAKSSLAHADREELAVMAVKRAFADCPSYQLLCDALLSRPLYQLYLACRLVPGVPISPMLAKPTKEIGEVLKRLSDLAFTMEYKYDGERAQVHLLPDGSVKIFSRNSLDDTNKYPDLAEVVRRAKHEALTSCVIDCEVVAFDREKGCLLPFQILSTRKRKVEDGEEDSQKVKVVLQGFDMLFLNGKSLLALPLRTRRSLLHASFRKEEGYFYFASGMDHVEDGDTAPIETFMTEACQAMCEGLMVKTLDDNATYEPSKRSLNWLKLKKDYIDGMGVCDSVDLVVLGAYNGKGKRANVYGAYLMACYDPDSDEFQSVCKVGTGFKDEELVRFTEKMKEHVLGSNKRPANYNVSDVLAPDVWFSAKVVWELQAADLSKSSAHTGAFGKVDPNRGIGLRFPRFIRERDDKPAESATSAEQIADMYNSQDLSGGGIDGGEEGDDDEDAL